MFSTNPGEITDMSKISAAEIFNRAVIGKLEEIYGVMNKRRPLEEDEELALPTGLLKGMNRNGHSADSTISEPTELAAGDPSRREPDDFWDHGQGDSDWS